MVHQMEQECGLTSMQCHDRTWATMQECMVQKKLITQANIVYVAVLHAYMDVGS